MHTSRSPLLIAAAFVAGLVVACDKGTAPPALEINAAGLSVGAQQLRISAAGQVTAGAEGVGSVHADGTFRVPDGRVVATISAAGQVTIPGEPGEQLEIAADGTVTSKGKVIAKIADDGTLSGGLVDELGAKGTAPRYDGPAAGRRAVMFAWLSAAPSKQ